MYNLSLNNEEILELQCFLQSAKVDHGRYWNETQAALLTKVIIARLDGNEAAERELQGERYAMNLHSMPKGA